MHQLMPTSLRPQPETHLLGLWYQTRNSPTSKQLILFIIPKYAQPWLRYIEIMNVIVPNSIWNILCIWYLLYWHSIICCNSDLSHKTISWLSPAPGQDFGKVRRLIQHRPHCGAEHHGALRNKDEMGVSENVVYSYTQWLMIIIPIKWLFHWEYTLFSDKPKWKKTKLWKLLTENEESWHFNLFFPTWKTSEFTIWGSHL